MTKQINTHPTTGYAFSDTIEISRNSSEMAKKENRDCVVRALTVFLDTDYEDAHKFCSDYLRRAQGNGIFNFEGKMRNDKLKSLVRETYGVSYEDETKNLARTPYIKTRKLNKKTYQRLRKTRNDEIKFRKKTVMSFMKENHKGTYLVTVRGHAFTIKDGVIHGNHSDARRKKAKILTIFKLNEVLNAESI